MPLKKLTISLMIITIISLLLYQCPEETPEPDYDIFLSLDYVFCTYVTLKVTIPDSGNINRFMIKRDGEEIINTTLLDDDTLITDSGLEPDTDYTYRSYFLKGNTVKDSSDEITVHTMPTTSHDFIWEIDTLGIYGSYLKDVWIVDENNILVVGNIETDSGRYNIAKWNGNQWSLDRVGPEGNNLYSIFTFSEDDIWVTNYCSPYHWDGTTWTYYRFSSGGVGVNACAGNALWGTSSSNLYFVGLEGSIVHYDGQNFEKMESGTDVDLVDIWGTSENNIWVCGYTQTVGTVILYYDGKRWNQFHYLSYSEYINLDSERISGPIVSVWTDSPNYLWAITYWGLYYISSGNSKEFIRYPDIKAWRGYILNLRGNSSNDIFFSGYESTIWHYNGNDFHHYSELVGNAALYGMEVKGSIICAVGCEYGIHRAVVLTGHR